MKGEDRKELCDLTVTYCKFRMQASLEQLLRSVGFVEVIMQLMDWSNLTTGKRQGDTEDIIVFYFTAMR